MVFQINQIMWLWNKIKDAIPQYNTGHIKKMHDLVTIFDQHIPRFRLTGNYIDGSGIPHIINYAKSEAMKIKEMAKMTETA